MKSDLEKQSILERYKVFLKTCNFDMQILIKSSKQDLHIIINNLKKSMNNNPKKSIIYSNYIDYLKQMVNQKGNTNKSFYIVINEKISNSDSIDHSLKKLATKTSQVLICLNNIGNYTKLISDREECSKLVEETIKNLVT